MDSIVVVGDSRCHEVSGVKKLPVAAEIAGGVHLMTDAIHRILDERGVADVPQIYGLERNMVTHEFEGHVTPSTIARGLTRWRLDKTAPQNLHKCFRLTEEQHCGECSFSIPSESFLDVLHKGGFAGRGPEHEEKQIAPDVVVIDDLGQELQSLEFDTFDNIDAQNASYETFLSERAKEVADAKRNDAELAHKYKELLCGERSREDVKSAFDALKENRRTIMNHTMAMLFSRLQKVGNSVNAIGSKYPVEPVVLVSLAGDVDQLDLGSTEGRTYIQHLYSNPALRRRTVVIVSAEMLRKKVSISSGLSWERTAQDTIIELKRDEKLRRVLDFGFVVVRFGITGLLLISRDDHSSALCFNPDQDDSTWQHPGDDGTVLGVTSLLCASIVESLNERCSWRNGQTVLSDLHRALDDALPNSIQRQLIHFNLGYAGSKSKGLIGTFRKLESNKWFHRWTLLSPRGYEDIEEPSKAQWVTPQLSPIPAGRSRHFSILSQSCQYDLNEVARDVVLHGSKAALNTVLNPVQRFARSVVAAFGQQLRRRAALFSFFAFSCDDENDPQPIEGEKNKDGVEQLDDAANKVLQAIRYHLEQVAKNEYTMKRRYGLDFFGAISSLISELDTSDLQDKKGPGQFIKRDLMDLHRGLMRFDTLLKECRQLVFSDALFSEKDNDLIEEFIKKSDNPIKMKSEMDAASPTEAANRIFEEGANSLARRYLHNTCTDKKLVEHFGDTVAVLMGLDSFRKDPPGGSIAPAGAQEDSRPDNVDLRLARNYAEFKRKYFSVEPGLLEGGIVSEVSKKVGEIERDRLDRPRQLIEQAIANFVSQMLGRGNRDSISAPILRLGKIDKGKGKDKDLRLIIIDRKEVESISAVRRMIQNYLKDESPERPLSVAVFGPPGAGKSVAVKQMIDMFSDQKLKLKRETINLSQLPDIAALNRRLDDIARLQNIVPVIFFDEFDSTLNDQQHGWLKYFLAAMEDGEHNGNEIKKAVFVFAGGMSSSFEEFSLSDRSRSDPQWVEFARSKGPDFVSRLRGHIDVVGINPAGLDDDLYLVRRALVLRFQLTLKQNLGDCDEAKIDDFMLNAFLHIPQYRHGARSMRMLLDLCTNKNGDVISMSEMPPIQQLNMQVDGKAFSDFATGRIAPSTRSSRDIT